jgi:hypothetical protein
VADYWIKIRTCSGDGLPTEIVADLARAIRQAADHRPWQVAIALSADALEDVPRAVNDEPMMPIDSIPPHS